jgi:hypothetical protein
MAVPTKARNVFALSNTKTLDSNPAQAMDECVLSVFVLSCVDGGLATG